MSIQLEKQKLRPNLHPTPSPLFEEGLQSGSYRGGELIIDLKAVAANYQLLCQKVKPGLCAGVVKADAYGLGAKVIARHLLDQGCRHFFVACLPEGIHLRTWLRATSLSDQVAIYVLHGIEKDSEDYYDEFNLIPICSTQTDCEAWLDYVQQIDKKLPFGLQFDTGMHRLGWDENHWDRWTKRNDLLQKGDLRLVMSHLACSDEPQHKMNQDQLAKFQKIRQKFPNIPASFANSAGIFLGKDYHFDLVRPGAALYGINPHPGSPNPLQPVVELYTTIKHIHESPVGDTVGYGATYQCSSPRRLATVTLGYADGMFRKLGGSHDQPKGFGYWQGQKIPVAGRVSMDLMVFDITDCQGSLPQIGDKIELIGPHQSLDDFAATADTIGYEIITTMKAHHQRTYRL